MVDGRAVIDGQSEIGGHLASGDRRAIDGLVAVDDQMVRDGRVVPDDQDVVDDRVVLDDLDVVGDQVVLGDQDVVDYHVVLADREAHGDWVVLDDRVVLDGLEVVLDLRMVVDVQEVVDGRAVSHDRMVVDGPIHGRVHVQEHGQEAIAARALSPALTQLAVPAVVVDGQAASWWTWSRSMVDRTPVEAARNVERAPRGHHSLWWCSQRGVGCLLGRIVDDSLDRAAWSRKETERLHTLSASCRTEASPPGPGWTAVWAPSIVTGPDHFRSTLSSSAPSPAQ